jgi:soluble lytic murein transglycosylase-like protein
VKRYNFNWLQSRRFLSFSVLSLLLLLRPNIEKPEARQAREVKKVYSVLKAHDLDVMSEASRWNVAQSVIEESAKHSLDPMLILAVMKVESRFDHKAVSPRGALGLMQIRSVVVNELAGEGEIPNSKGEQNLTDPRLNIKIGVAYLSYLKKMFRDLRLALAAYNSGPTRVRSKLVAKKQIPLGYANKVVATQHSFYG